MGKIAVVLPNETYAAYPLGVGGSHIPNWSTIKILSDNGVKTLVLIIMPDANVLPTHMEDIRRSRQEMQIEQLYMRIGDWGELNTPQDRFNQIQSLLAYALQWYPTVTLLAVNELRVDFSNLTVSQALQHTSDLRDLLRAKFGNRIRVASPTINAYTLESESDLTEIVNHSECYDVLSGNIYPHNVGELNTKWSIPWYLAKAKEAARPVFFWEYNGHPTMKDAAGNTTFTMSVQERDELLMKLHVQVLDCTDCEGGAYFILSSSDPKFQELELNAKRLAEMLSVIGGWRPTIPTIPPPTTSVILPPSGVWNPQALWDFGSRLVGGIGWNENTAFGGYVKEHPSQGPYGFPIADILGYDQPAFPFLYQLTTCGCFLYHKVTHKVSFCQSPEQALALGSG